LTTELNDFYVSGYHAQVAVSNLHKQLLDKEDKILTIQRCHMDILISMAQLILNQPFTYSLVNFSTMNKFAMQLRTLLKDWIIEPSASARDLLECVICNIPPAHLKELSEQQRGQIATLVRRFDGEQNL